MRLHYLQHVPFEHPAGILEWALARGFLIDATRLYAGEPLPALEDFDWLVLMGGPMNVYEYDRYPWLAAEHELVGRAARAGKTVLGICLGAQLIACALGGRVRRNREREIGWYPIAETDACRASPWAGVLGEGLAVLHWHGDTFTPPPGALHLATSRACAQQGFVWGGRVLALQFHLELGREDLARLVECCAEDLAAGGRFVQAAADMLAPDAPFDAARAALERALERLHAA